MPQALAGAAHDLAQRAAFGACFAVCLAGEIIPGSLRESLRRGADAGRQAAADRSTEQAATSDLPPPMMA